MKLIDNIINKFGSDKILHFLVGGYLTCLSNFNVGIKINNR